MIYFRNIAGDGTLVSYLLLNNQAPLTTRPQNYDECYVFERLYGIAIHKLTKMIHLKKIDGYGTFNGYFLLGKPAPYTTRL